MSLWPLAFLAGAISFSSPCCLPLLPGYLAHVSGLVEARDATRRRSRTVLGAVLFVLGFTLIFALLGASAGLLGGILLGERALLLAPRASSSLRWHSCRSADGVPRCSRGPRSLRRRPA